MSEQIKRATTDAVNAVLRGKELTKEQRTYVPLSTTTTTGGSVTIPQVLDSVNSVLKTYGNLSSICTVLQTETGSPVQVGILDSTSDDGTIPVTENSAQALGPNPVVAQLSAPLGAAVWQSGIIQMSNSLFIDSQVSPFDLFFTQFTARFSRGTSKFIATNNVTGLTNSTTGMTGVALGVATAPTWDELTNLQASIPSAYLFRATYVFTTATYLYFRGLKNSAGAYLWQPIEYLQNKISGLPYVVCDNLDNIGASKKPIWLGDFSQLTLRRAGSLNLRVYRELYAQQQAVGMSADARIDSQVIVPQAFAFLHG